MPLRFLWRRGGEIGVIWVSFYLYYNFFTAGDLVWSQNTEFMHFQGRWGGEIGGVRYVFFK